MPNRGSFRAAGLTCSPPGGVAGSRRVLRTEWKQPALFQVLFGLTLLLGVSAALPIGVAAKRSPAELGPPSLPVALRRSRSLGHAWKGRLVRGVKLQPSARVRYVTEYVAADHFYGAWQLVQLLERAAHGVAQRAPGARLSVGELSAREGGNLPGHASHENGRDADVGFYMLDGAGRPYDAFAFANFDDRGRGVRPNQGLRFDVARNWELIARLVSDGEARVQYVFVSPGLRWLLLDHGRRVKAAPRLLERAARVMVPPSERHPHGNHFHVRVYCGPHERPKCEDEAPYWPWYPGSAPRLL
jgi:penicillin-insensitive murein endopeptidase